jgi:hypothetical protein
MKPDKGKTKSLKKQKRDVAQNKDHKGGDHWYYRIKRSKSHWRPLGVAGLFRRILHRDQG